MSEATRKVPWWVKALVLFHVFMTVSWSLPGPAKAVSQGVAKPRGEEVILYANEKFKSSFVSSYLTWTGFWQSWDMFAPNPSSVDIWCHAELEFADGSEGVFNYPRIYDLPIPVKYLKERYRKFYERVNQDDNAYIWPFFAHRIALLGTKDIGNPVVKVRLVRHFRYTPPLGQPVPKDYQSYQYYEHEVDLAKLAKEFKR